MDQTLQKFKTLASAWAYVPFLVLVFGMLSLGFAGCRGNADDRTEIQLSSWGSSEEVSVLKNILSEFEHLHPEIKVNLLHIPDNYYQKLHILVAGDMTPDVIFTNSISFPIYASQGVFLDLQPYLAKAAQANHFRREDLYPSALAAFTWKTSEGKTILGALPRDISNLVIFYNKDLFAKAGLSEPKSGWTWDEFVETAEKLTVDQNHDGDPDQFGISFYSTPPLFWLPFVWSSGGALFSADLNQIVLDRPEALRGLQFYADLRNQSHVAPKKVESGGATMSQLFMQEKLAMMVNGRWSVPVLRQQAKFNWDVVPFPVGPGGKSRVGIDASGYAISAKSLHPQESFELIQFLLSRQAIEKVTESGLIVPARVDVAESKAFLAPGEAPAHGRAFLDVIPEGMPTHTPARWNEISEELILTLEPVWDGRQDATSAIKTAKPKLERMLEVSP